jgi:hypothetical protein
MERIKVAQLFDYVVESKAGVCKGEINLGVGAISHPPYGKCGKIAPVGRSISETLCGHGPLSWESS